MVDTMLGLTHQGLFVYGEYMKGPVTFVVMDYDEIMEWYTPMRWRDINSPTFKIIIRDDK